MHLSSGSRVPNLHWPKLAFFIFIQLLEVWASGKQLLPVVEGLDHEGPHLCSVPGLLSYSLLCGDPMSVKEKRDMRKWVGMGDTGGGLRE